MRSDDGGIGYRHLPSSAKDVVTDILSFGDAQVEVREHWRGYGELGTIRQSLAVFRPGNLRGLIAVEFVNRRLLQARTGRPANAKYNRRDREIILSRSGARDYSTLASNELNHALAVATVRHEVAHHI